MRRVPITNAILLSALGLLLSSCAQTGAPLPPSLELPRPPSDLRATRKANVVTLTWSEPALTTDRQTVRYLGPTRICRSAEATLATCETPVATAPPSSTAMQKFPKKSQPKPPTLRTYSDTVSPSLFSENPEAELAYAVEVLNRNARGAGLSNLVHVPAIATLPAPADLAANLTDDGVVLSWTNPGAPPEKAAIQYRYRVYRHTATFTIEITNQTTNAPPAQVVPSAATPGAPSKHKIEDVIVGEIPVGPPGRAEILDAAEWEKTYQYWVTVVTVANRATGEVQVEGDNSPVLRVVAHDIFPPAAPAGLQAVYSGEGQKPFIDLIWAPVASADLAGYNAYRREAGGSAVKLNSGLIKTPSYRDAAVMPGKTYTYSVSAVDVRGNESSRSEEATESAP